MDIQSFIYGYLFQFDKNGKDLINYGKVQGGSTAKNSLERWSTTLESGPLGTSEQSSGESARQGGGLYCKNRSYLPFESLVYS